MFVSSKFKTIEIIPDKDYLTNVTINLDFCKHFYPSTFKYKTKNSTFFKNNFALLYSIKFKGCDAFWVFGNRENRDNEYKRLLELCNC